MDFKNVSIIVKAIFLILFCIQMISSVLASESATFAQIIAATEVAYVLQKTYNSSMLVEPIEQDYVDGLSIKPPNRYGHTMIRRGKLFGENKNIRVFDKAVLFGGLHNGSRGDVWTFKAGMVNSGGSDPTMKYAAEGDTFENAIYECSLTKKTDTYSHVCNTWIKNTDMKIMKKNCASSSTSRNLDILQVENMCFGVDTNQSMFELSQGNNLILQDCYDTYNQRVYVEEVSNSNCGNSNLINLTTIQGQCVRFRYDTKMTEWGNRSVGLCLTRSVNESSTFDKLELNNCLSSNTPKSAQHFFLATNSLKFNGKGYHILSAYNNELLCMAAVKGIDSYVNGIDVLQLGLPVRLEKCDESSYFQSIFRRKVKNECMLMEHQYIETNENVARANHVAGLATSKSSILGEYFPKMFVFGGRNELTSGSLNDMWSFDIDRNTWIQISDGITWTQSSDTHLHAQLKIRSLIKNAFAQASDFQDLKNDTSMYSDYSNPFPKPRFGHTGTMVYHTTESTIAKQVPILVEREFTDATYETAMRQVFDIGSIIFAEDSIILNDPTSPTKTKARQREAKLWSKAKINYGWDGINYPFAYNYAEQGSNILNWTITLKSNFTLELKRPIVSVEKRDIVQQDDNFTLLTISLSFSYNEIHEYTCLNMTHQCRQENLEECAYCGGADYTTWNTGYETYKLKEWKQQTIKAKAVTAGLIRMLVFGGWTNHEDGSQYISSELWAFDYKSQLSSITEYDPDIYDTLYHTFPCCGSEQECCGTFLDSTFERCKGRRQTNVTGTCIGSLPNMNRWSLVETKTYGDGRPEGRFHHAAVNLGGYPSSSPTRDRLIIFGGQGKNGYLNDIWELSLDSSPTDAFQNDLKIECDKNEGWIEIVFYSLTVNNNVTVKSGLILHNETVGNLKQKLNLMDTRLTVEIKNSSMKPYTICQSGDIHLSIKTTLSFLREFGNYTSVSVKGNHHSEYQTQTIVSNSSNDTNVVSNTTSSTTANNTAANSTTSNTTNVARTVKIEFVSTFNSTFSQYTWYKTDNGISDSSKPSRRKQHVATVTIKNNKEVVFIYGGWNGNALLNDVWVYTPSVSGGTSGSYSMLKDNGGKYRVCMPNFSKGLVTIFGKTCWTNQKSNFPYVYSNALVSLTSDFDPQLSSNGGTALHESLYSYGGVNKDTVPTGDNWDIYGFWGGGRDPEFFGICHDEKTSFCKIPLYVKG
jgi:hypothetical protein